MSERAISPSRMGKVGPLIVVTMAAACVTERTSPLGDLTGVTRIEVSHGGNAKYAFHSPADSVRIAMVAEVVRARQSGWQESRHTLPAGDVTVSFLRDSALLGVLWVGSELLVARGTGKALITSISRVEELHLRALLDTVTVLGTIGSQPPRPP